MATRHTATAVGLAALLASGSALAAAEWTFSDWDEDGNLELTEQEFEAGVAELGVHDEWDVNEDEVLAEDEFYQGVYGAWDRDADESITEDEFATGADRWFGDLSYDAFAEWDANNDEVLDQEEFYAGAEETGLYDDWVGGTAAGIGEEEFYGGVYERADVDDDLALTEYESGWFDWF